MPLLTRPLFYQIHQLLDPVSKQRKGIAYISFTRPSDTLAAYEALGKKSCQGRLLHILGAVDRRTPHSPRRLSKMLNVLRQKTGVGYDDGKEMPGCKRKLDFGKTGEEEDPELEE